MSDDERRYLDVLHILNVGTEIIAHDVENLCQVLSGNTAQRNEYISKCRRELSQEIVSFGND